MVGISLHSVVPVRTEAREGAEQETQMLFGELCTIIEEQPRWYRVQLANDGTEGWVDAKMIAPIEGKDYTAYKKAYASAATVAYPMTYAVSENNGQTIPLTAGTKLTKYEVQCTQYEGREVRTGHFELLGVGFRIDPNMVIISPLPLDEAHLLQTARFFLNIPYLWGGKNAMGMDCSGFTQVLMSLFGKSLPRNASEQAKQGRIVNGIEKIKAGDLVFFSHEGEERITHVGIAIDKERVIHCSGRVKVEPLDAQGIYSAEQGGYSHRLIGIKRL